MPTKNNLLFPLILVAGFALPCAAQAACGPGKKELFYCDASKGRIIQLCEAASSIEYTFGNPKKPDIVLTVPKDKTTTNQWSGMGPMSYDVSVPNGDTIYTVFWSFDRDPDHDPVGGVDVEAGQKSLGQVKCLANKPIRSNLDEADLPHAD